MNFPTSPTNGQTATVNNIVYTYNSANTTWTRTPGIIPDISTGNVSATGFVSAVGNVTGAYIFGNGSQLTGLPAGYANSNAVAYGEAGWAGNIIPSANATYSLGTAANQWKSLYLSNSTLYLANVAINMGSGNVLQVAGSNVVTAGANNAISTAGNVTGGNILTGGVVSATGNVTGGNINTNNIVSSGTLNVVATTIALAPTGNVTMNARYITNLSNPVQDQDAATKNYVDTVATGLHVHAAANLASTSDLATYTGATVTYSNGTSGVGATLSLVGNTLTTLDGTAIPSPATTRLLIKNQANAVLNGVYNYTSSSLLTRSPGEDTNGELNGGDFLFVLSGATQADTGWVQTTDNVVIGTSSIVFSQFSGAGTYTANTSAGLSLIGTVFNAKVDDTTTAFDGGGNISIKTGAVLTTPNIGAATGTSLSVTGTVTSASVVGGVITGTSTSVSGNTTAGNLLTGGVVSASGNVTGNYILGNGSLLSGIITSVSNINNGTSNITVVSSGGNAAVSIGGTPNVAVYATTGEYITGLISATGNITGGNVISGGVRVYKWTTQANTAPTGAVPGDSWYDSYASKLYLYINDGTGNQWVDQSFPTTFANLSVTGNIQGGNVTTTGLVSATGNITGNYFVGNGSALTGLSASKIYNGTSEANIGTSGGNANITIGGTSNVVVVATTGVYVTGLTSVTGNVTAAGHVGTIYTNSIINTGSNATGNIGSAALYFNTVFAKATSAQYADLAEKYLADAEYAPGTVVSFGGVCEVTLSQTANDPRIAGVVSSYPAHVMNAGLQDELAVTVALTGRVPTSVVGGVLKGDMMVSAGNGFAQACATPAMGTVIGKSLENFHGESGVIEIVVGKL